MGLYRSKYCCCGSLPDEWLLILNNCNGFVTCPGVTRRSDTSSCPLSHVLCGTFLACTEIIMQSVVIRWRGVHRNAARHTADRIVGADAINGEFEGTRSWGISLTNAATTSVQQRTNRESAMFIVQATQYTGVLTHTSTSYTTTMLNNTTVSYS